MDFKRMFKTLGLVFVVAPIMAACGKCEHTYTGEPEWVWTDDYKATAKFSCEKCEEIGSFEAVVTDSITTNATCGTDAVKTYVAKVTVGETEYTDSKVVTVTGSATGNHTYGQPTFVWSADNSYATAKFTCGVCSHEETVNAVITDSVKTPASCTANEVKTLTATAAFGGQNYTDHKDVEITDTKTAHVYTDHYCTCGAIELSCITPTVASINSWSNGGLDFGWFQYGGEDGTTIAVNKGVDNAKSLEKDSSYRKVSIDGEGSTADRMYAIYFKLKNHRNAIAEDVQPKAVTFVVYNEVAGGGLAFFVGDEITSGIKAYSADGEFINENNRSLDFVGFRRYVIEFKDSMMAENEMQIAIWGASLNTVVDYSAFGFIFDESVEETSLGNVSTCSFDKWDQDDKTGCEKELVTTPYTVDSDGKAMKFTRNASDGWGSANLYFNLGDKFSGKNPVLVKFTVYNAIKIDDFSNNGINLHYGNWGVEAHAINEYEGLDYLGFRTYAFAIPEEALSATQLHINIWGVAAAEIYLSGFSIISIAE